MATVDINMRGFRTVPIASAGAAVNTYFDIVADPANNLDMPSVPFSPSRGDGNITFDFAFLRAGIDESEVQATYTAFKALVAAYGITAQSFFIDGIT